MEPAGNGSPIAAVVVMVWRDGRVLLVQRGNPPRQGCWGLPGGRLRFGESLEAGALRELWEETGLAAPAASAVTAFDVLDRDADGAVRRHFVLIALQAADPGGAAIAGDDARAVGWFAPDALPLPHVLELPGVLRQALERCRAPR